MSMLITADAHPPAPQGLTSADIRRLRHSLDQSVSDNTRKMYASPGGPSKSGPDTARRWLCQPHLRW